MITSLSPRTTPPPQKTPSSRINFPPMKISAKIPFHNVYFTRGWVLKPRAGLTHHSLIYCQVFRFAEIRHQNGTFWVRLGDENTRFPFSYKTGGPNRFDF
ncbi:hypothetical protein EVAR_31221_1 [Eumeta japonica]|uniref:Uncharacterized protein n=1 Tax=Eumeta variegata TaxID=151549 RepID=A0A4C1VZ61_EUMVA|nr:hypothetical protein EVAR_31221_1 [Eumeta japonica]